MPAARKKKPPKGLILATEIRFLRDLARLIPPEYPEDLETVRQEMEVKKKQLYRMIGLERRE